MRLLIFIYSAQSSYDKNRVGKNATLNTKDKDGFGSRYCSIGTLNYIALTQSIFYILFLFTNNLLNKAMSYISLYEMGKWRDIFLEIITIINSQQE